MNIIICLSHSLFLSLFLLIPPFHRHICSFFGIFISFWIVFYHNLLLPTLSVFVFSQISSFLIIPHLPSIFSVFLAIVYLSHSSSISLHHPFFLSLPFFYLSFSFLPVSVTHYFFTSSYTVHIILCIPKIPSISIFLSTYLSTSISFCLYISLSTYLFICLSICLARYLLIYLSLYLFS